MTSIVKKSDLTINYRSIISPELINKVNRILVSTAYKGEIVVELLSKLPKLNSSQITALVQLLKQSGYTAEAIEDSTYGRTEFPTTLIVNLI